MHAECLRDPKVWRVQMGQVLRRALTQVKLFDDTSSRRLHCDSLKVRDPASAIMRR